MAITLHATPGSTLVIAADDTPLSDGPLLLVELDRRPVTALADPLIETTDARVAVTGMLKGTPIRAAWTATRIAGDAWELGLELRNEGTTPARITRMDPLSLALAGGPWQTRWHPRSPCGAGVLCVARLRLRRAATRQGPRRSRG